MKLFRGAVQNIHEPLLCRIVSEAPSWPVNGYFFPFTYQQQNTTGSGIILSRTGASSHLKSIPLFQLNGDDISLESGDIVLLEPSGVGTVLYQSKSHTNSVLLTEKCNCRCIMCPQPPQNDTEDFVDLSLRTIRLMDANTKTLCITGGEPTIVWEGLKKVLSVCRAYIPSASIQILTNARILKDYSKAEELAREGGSIEMATEK